MISPSTPDWQIFETIVTQIHKTLSPKATVTHDDKILGHDSKKLRQIDMSLRERIGPYPVLGIVQCRNYKRKIDVNDVGEFVTVIKDVKAHVGVIVSNAGFTDGAVNLARANNVNLCSVFDAQNKDWSVIIELPVICDFRKPIIRGRFNVTAPQPASFPLDVNKMEFVRANGEIISFRTLFLRDWNDGKVKADVGTHIHTPTANDLYIRSEGGVLTPINVTFEVEVQSSAPSRSS